MASVFFIDFCSLVFQCGCHSLWAGADAACNIHSAASHHCPWCARNAAFAYASMIVPQALISFWPATLSWKARLAGALAAFPLFGAISAAVYGIASGYWRS